MDEREPVMVEITRQHLQLKNEIKNDLIYNILPYWMNKMVDDKHGGFFGRRDGYDNLDAAADKGVILNTRILWTFSRAARAFSSDKANGTSVEKYRATAGRAFECLVKYFFDHEKGGVYWMLDHTGKPVATKKQIYAQAFAIYALTEYYLATRQQHALDLSIQLFHLIEQYSFDPLYNGYLEAFDRDWNLLEDLRLSDKDANEKKTMNTHLHVLEAYTNLYRCWKDDTLAKQLRNLVILFRDIIINSKNHFNLFFDERWNVKSDVISFGHDIEGAWLLVDAAKVLEDVDLVRDMEEKCLKIVDVTVREGMDTDGSLMNEANSKEIFDTDKHWWPQAEAIVGLLNAWEISERQDYFDNAVRVWSFIKNKLIDESHGEWYWRVNRAGVVSFDEDKAGPWKCPYHNGRTAFEVMERLRAL